MLALLLALAVGASAKEPPRVVLETTAGDLVLAMRPDAAPKQVARFLELVRLGVYDFASVERIDPTLYIRFSPASRRKVPLSPAQRRAVARPRPAIETGLPHDFGVVTVAHAAGEKDDSGTALAIMLVRVPPMDGRFSAFAVVERGREVLDYLRDEPCGPDHAPVTPVLIRRAIVVDAAAARSLPLRAPPARRRFDATPAWAAAAAGLVLFFLSSSRLFRSVALLGVLAGFFLGFAASGGAARQSPWLGTLLFAAAIGVFRLMSSFESGS